MTSGPLTARSAIDRNLSWLKSSRHTGVGLVAAHVAYRAVQGRPRFIALALTGVSSACF